MIFVPIALAGTLLSITVISSHFLLLLLNLEIITIIIITLAIINASYLIESIPPLIILSLSACEASLGLSILVSIIRQNGNDNININFTNC